MRTISFALLAGLGCALASAPAHAEWVWTLGASISSAPAYEGAGHNTITPMPVIRLRHPDTAYRFVPPDDGPSLALFSTDVFSIGPVARFQGSRESKGNLVGLKEIDWAGEIGVFADLWAAPWLRGHIEFRKGVTGHDGWVGDAGIDFIYNGEGWDASIGPRIGYGDSEYRDTYFGVTAAEVVASPFISSTYAPGGGLRYVGVETALSFDLSNSWQTIFDVGYRSLDDDLADSPVVAVSGSQDQWNAGITITYTFGQ